MTLLWPLDLRDHPGFGPRGRGDEQTPAGGGASHCRPYGCIQTLNIRDFLANPYGKNRKRLTCVGLFKDLEVFTIKITNLVLR